jgi:hypothetical protein
LFEKEQGVEKQGWKGLAICCLRAEFFKKLSKVRKKREKKNKNVKILSLIVLIKLRILNIRLDFTYLKHHSIEHLIGGD